MLPHTVERILVYRPLDSILGLKEANTVYGEGKQVREKLFVDDFLGRA